MTHGIVECRAQDDRRRYREENDKAEKAQSDVVVPDDDRFGGA